MRRRARTRTPSRRYLRLSRATALAAVLGMGALAWGPAAPAANLSAAQNADMLLGASGYASVQRGANQAWALDAPKAVHMDASGRVYVADHNNNRVPVWNGPFASPPFPDNGQTPSWYIGNLSGTDYRWACNAQRSREPDSAWTGGGRMAVADGSQDRVLLWDSIPTSTGAAASRVLGQTSLTTCATARPVGASTLSDPQGVWTDGTKIAVADAGNNRVLLWNSWPASNDAPANVVLGQPDFVSNADDALGASASTLDGPTAVWSDGTKLLVADRDNNRVLVWDSWPTTNAQPASFVLGQSTMTGTGTSCTSAGMSIPEGVSSDGTRIAVAAATQHRVLLYDSWPTANGAAATRVLGQTGLGSCGRNRGSSTLDAIGLDRPNGVWTDGTNVLVADTNHHRVLAWSAWPATGAAATRVLGATDFAGAAGNATSAGYIVAHHWNRTITTATGHWLAVNPATTGLFMSSARDSALTYYGSEPATINQAPDWQFAQDSTRHSLCNRVTGNATQGKVCQGMGIWTDGTRLLVADSGSDRVLVWNSFPVDQNDTPDLAIGQSTWTGNSGATAQDRMDDPTSVASDGSRVAVVDKENHRVLLWDSWPTVMGQPADRVLGQTSWTGRSSNNGGRSASSLDDPLDVAMWGGRLAVADRDNDRVLVWNSWPTATFNAPADAAVGVADFTSSGTLDNARGVHMDANTLFITDEDCAMLLDPIPSSGTFVPESSTSTIGTCSAGSTDVNPSQNAIDNPSDITAYAGRVWVSNSGHARVMRWTDNIAPTITVSPAVTNGCAGTTFAWTTSESGTSEVYWGPTSQAAYTGYPNSSIDSTHTGLVHTHTVASIPAGTYFYRVRTVDWRGQSVVSAESTFVAPTAPAAPTALFSNDSNAQAGTANNAGITLTTPRLSWINNAPCAVDRQRTQVVTDTLDNVVGLWHMDENSGASVADASGNGRAIALSGAPASPGWAPGTTSFGTALSFDGSDDRAVIASHPAFDLDVFTIDLWFNVTTIANSSYPSLITRDDGTNFNRNFKVYFDSASNTLVGAVSVGGAASYASTPATPYVDGMWHHVALTVSGTSMLLYVDGVQRGSALLAGSNIDNPAANIDIGQAPGLQGRIDELRISNAARTAAEIAGYYRSRLPHYQTMWDSDPTDAGIAQAGCAQSARCADLTHGATGTGLPLGGGRYYARQKVRLGSGTWSLWATWDWLETRLGRPVNLYVDDVTAATGVANRTGISSNTPRMTWSNTSGGSIDRQQTQVVTTPLDNVVGLWHLDGGVADASGYGHSAILGGGAAQPVYSAGQSGFGQGLTMDGGDTVTINSTAALDVDTYTVEIWFRTNAQAGFRSLLTRPLNAPSRRNFDLHFDDTNLVAEVTTNNGANFYSVTTPEAPLEDGRWHHVATTVDGSWLRLYVDGVQVGTPAAITGDVDNPPQDIFIGHCGNSCYFAGDVDEARISNVARSTSQIAGYYATRRPHYEVLWDSGEATVAACADLSRCSDVTYAGPAMVRTGARFHARSRMRPAGGTWSLWSDWDWFETTPSISLAVPSGSSADFGPVSPGANYTAATDIEVTSTAAPGYTLTSTNASDSYGMTDGSAPHIPAWTGSPATPTTWAPSASPYFGITVLGATGGKDTARWGTGTTATDYTNNRYAGPLSSTSTTLHTRDAYTGGTDTVNVSYRLHVDDTIPVGAYTTTVTYTAVTNP